METLRYAAFLTMVVSRRLVALGRRRPAALADRIPAQRWAAVFTAVAHDLLAAVLRPPRAVSQLLREVQRVLLHEAVDSNAARHGLLVAVEQRTHRHHPMAAVP